MRKFRWLFAIVVVISLVVLALPVPLLGAEYVIDWTRQFGTASWDFAVGAVDSSGNLYLAGYTGGTLPGQISSGLTDAFVRKYDPTGGVLWTHQFGTSTDDAVFDAAIDSSGNLYVAGSTGRLFRLSGPTTDVFVRKYDPTGGVLWTHQFGSLGNDFGTRVAVDSGGNLYLAGETDGTLPGQISLGLTDAFVRKYDPTGGVLFTHQFGTSSDDVLYGAAVDSTGNLYVAGETDGALPGQISSGLRDTFVRKYDPTGGVLWTHQAGSSSRDFVTGAAVDSTGNLYVVGDTEGALPGQIFSGLSDVFVRKYDPTGGVLFTHQFGTSSYEFGSDPAVDSGGNLYLVGYTDGTLPGQISSGLADTFVRKYDPSGGVLFTHQFGTSSTDMASGAAIDPSGNLYVVGDTDGTFPGQSYSGNWDVYAVKFVLANTSVGSNVTPTGLPPGVSMTFSQVTGAGQTTVTTTTTAPSPPSGFQLLGTYYEIATTAQFVAPITIGFSYNEADLPPGTNEANLKVFHWENSQWVDVTTSVDTVNNIVYAQVNLLSPFALGFSSPPTGVNNSALFALGLIMLFLGTGLLLSSRKLNVI